MIKYESATELAEAMQRAEAAHAVYEKTLGHRDEDWQIWYAEFMEKEQVNN